MDPDICPPWWPKLLWQLHYFPHPPGVGPINYPPAIEDMMSALAIHTMSYMLLDQAQAQQIRDVAQARLVETAGQLSALHEAAIGELPQRELAGQIS